MNKRRELLAAGIVRDFRFISQAEFKIYIYGLEHKHTEYKILETCSREDGSVLARIVQEYNTAPLIELYQD